jgi:hypothetical protein
MWPEEGNCLTFLLPHPPIILIMSSALTAHAASISRLQSDTFQSVPTLSSINPNHSKQAEVHQTKVLYPGNVNKEHMLSLIHEGRKSLATNTFFVYIT